MTLEPTKAPSSTVFVGNVPYGVTEEQLAEVFGQCGPVKSFRIVTDRDSGKPKGYAFCNFYDVPTAQSAQRNLNGYEINGRTLRVDFAEETSKPERYGPRDTFHGPPGPGPGPREEPKPQPQLVGGVGLVAAATAAQAVAAMDPRGPTTAIPGAQDAISLLLAQKKRPELYEILAQMKGLLQQNPAQARHILVQNPQLARALLQAQVLLGMVRLPAGGSLGPVPGPALHPASGGQTPPLAPLPGVPLAHTQPGQQGGGLGPQRPGLAGPSVMLGPRPGEVPPQQLQQGLPMGELPEQHPQHAYLSDAQQQHAPHTQQQLGPHGAFPADVPVDPRLQQAAPMPRPAPYQAAAPVQHSQGLPGQHGPSAAPVQQAPCGQQGPGGGRQGPGPQQQPQPLQAPSLASNPVDQQKLLEQVMKLTPEQVERLPPEQKNTILLLQQHMGEEEHGKRLFDSCVRGGEKLGVVHKLESCVLVTSAASVGAQVKLLTKT